MAKCTLPDLIEVMKRVKLESTNRPCPVHRVHIIEKGKLRDDLVVEPPVIPTAALDNDEDGSDT